MKKVRFRSITLRYIISYAAVMAVLFIGIGIYVDNSYASAIHASIVEENTNRLSALRIQHEEKLSSLINIANQISLSPYIAPFLLEKNTMKAYNLIEYLASYNANSFFDQLYVIYHDDEYLYSSGTSVSIDAFTDHLMHYEGISPDSLREFLRKKDDRIYILPSMSVRSVLTSDTNKKMSTIIIPLRLDAKYTVGNAVFLVHDSAYQRMFADEIHQMRNMYIFSGNDVLSASRKIDIDDQTILNEISETDDVIRYITAEDGSGYILFSQRGTLLDMRYVSLIPQETVRMQTVRTRLAFSLFMLMLSIPCSLLTIYFSRKHVKPIKELQKSIGEDLSSGDGFTAIHRGIEALKGQNRALHSRLDESKNACIADFVKNFVKFRFSTREQAVNTATVLGMNIDRSFYCVTLMSAVFPDNNGLERLLAFSSDNERDVNGYGMEIIGQERYLFVLFADSQKSLETWVDNAKVFLASFDNEAVIAVSGIHVDFSEATGAYLEAATAYDNRFVMGNEHVLRFSDVSAAAKDIEPFSRSYLDGFRKALYSGDANALHERIDELFQILKAKKFSLFAFRIIYNDIVSMLLNKYFSYDGVCADTIQYYDIFELSGCRKTSDLIDILRKLCNDILRKEEQNIPNENSVIGQVIDYMRDNYTDPALSIGSIADIYGMSAASLSLKYKEQTGMYPSDYLLLLRMEKAKELLTRTKMSIQDIGTTVGYYDASSFIRRFKQHMGVTPKIYRKAMKNTG